MTICGIDPGKDGGVVIISGPSFAPEIHAAVMPMHGDRRGRREYDIVGMRALLAAQHLDHVFVERQQAMKSRGRFDGSAQAFSTGVGYAVWLGLLTGMQIPFEVVLPQTWQKEMLAGVMGNDTKVRAAQVAQRLHPRMDWRASQRARTLHEGIVDAFCIAEYGRRALAARRGFAEVET